MGDELIERVARAIGDCCEEMHISQLKLAAQAALAALKPGDELPAGGIYDADEWVIAAERRCEQAARRAAEEMRERAAYWFFHWLRSEGHSFDTSDACREKMIACLSLEPGE